MASTTSILGLTGLIGGIMHEATFERVAPTDDQLKRVTHMRGAFGLLLGELMKHVPDGPDRTFAIRQIRTAAMWCNMAITHNADGSPRTE